MGRIRKFRSLNRSEKLGFCEAGVFLLVSTLCVRAIAFKHIDRFLRTRWTEVPPDVFDCGGDIKLVERSVSRATLLWPWPSKCLSRSIATFTMLRRRGVPATLFAGARVSEDSSLYAHAWVGVGDEASDQRSEDVRYATLVRIG